jgi:chitosanase
MFYGIFGDSNGASPEVIGEASWRMGKACFPDGNISGANGHGGVDVTCRFHIFMRPSNATDFFECADIAFSGKDAVLPSADMTKNYITQFSKLKSMGDELVSSLASHLDVGSTGPEVSTKATGTSTKTTGASTKTTGVSTKANGKNP